MSMGMTRATICAALLLMAGLSGCGGGDGKKTSSIAPGLPDPGKPAALNTYVGTQPSKDFYGGVFSMTVDHDTNFFSFTDDNGFGIGSGGANYVGNFKDSGGFSLLTTTNFSAPPAYLLEIQGRGALLEMEKTEPPVIFVQNSDCLNFGGALDFHFIQMGGPSASQPGKQGYGSVKVSSANTGTVQEVWTFSDYSLHGIDGSDQKPAQLGPGTCAQSGAGFITAIPEKLNGQQVTSTMAIGASGLFIMDRDPNSGRDPLVGVLKPASALDTKALAAAEYRGFEFDSFGSSPQKIADDTLMVRFGGAPSGGSQMQGGVFPGSDPTKTPTTDLQLDLGSEDTTENGLYPSLKATFPDSSQACAGRPFGGTDPAGNSTCIFPGVAIAGQLEGKFVLFVTIQELGDGPGAATIQFLLYQK